MSDTCSGERLLPEPAEQKPEPKPCTCIDTVSLTETVSSGFVCPRPEVRHKISYDRIKQLLQQRSANSGETLYDHLVEIISHVIDERPPNVVDYFEQFSRDVRSRKLCPNKPICCLIDDPEFLSMAYSVLRSLKLPYVFDSGSLGEHEYDHKSEATNMTMDFGESEASLVRGYRVLQLNENIIQMQYLWMYNTMGFHIDEMYHLTWSIQKIQQHPCVTHARFWGKIHGTNASYYIAEAVLNRSEVNSRLRMMQTNLLEKMVNFIRRRREALEPIPDPDELVPGSGWQHYPEAELSRMRPMAEPVPRMIIDEVFEQPPPEFFGTGLNKKVYFVTTALSEEWQELPVITPQHIDISRKIKKYLTGNLNATIDSYPSFPGTEKHYLRAMIARITAGTYIAPQGFYRRMTLSEIAKMEMDENKDEFEVAAEMEDDDVFGEDEDQEDQGDDAYIIEDENYKPLRLEQLLSLGNWVHFRPHILPQGRIIYIDGELATKDLERRALAKIKAEEMPQYEYDKYKGEEFGIDEDEGMEEEEMGEEEGRPPPEIGPPLFTPCNEDRNKESVPSWTIRLTNINLKTNQMIFARSNLWPGAVTFTFENFCDSIYYGWGHKYIPRNFELHNLPHVIPVENQFAYRESTDPTVEMEERWRRYWAKKEDSLLIPEEMTDISINFDINDEEDDTN